MQEMKGPVGNPPVLVLRVTYGDGARGRGKSGLGMRGTAVILRWRRTLRFTDSQHIDPGAVGGAVFGLQ